MNKDFITATPDTGSGDATINVTASKNEGAARSTSVNIAGAGLTRTVTMNQDAKPDSRVLIAGVYGSGKILVYSIGTKTMNVIDLGISQGIYGVQAATNGGSPCNVAMASNGTTFISTDGATWTNNNSKAVDCIQMGHAPVSANIQWVGTNFYGHMDLPNSTWTRVNFNSKGDTGRGVAISNGKVFLLTSAYIRVSTDEGATFPYNENFKFELYGIDSRNGIVCAVGYENQADLGVYSTDGGATFPKFTIPDVGSTRYTQWSGVALGDTTLMMIAEVSQKMCLLRNNFPACTEVTHISTPYRPKYVCYDGQGKFYVTGVSSGQGIIAIYDATTGEELDRVTAPSGISGTLTQAVIMDFS